ncbi:DUF4124 domain-containing protein [Comamonas endophytica]|uniref:DUF4124 domain-containing protein n=1 Tax=Comamonas endophytica TaxID=2949090 RepID=A0ABY6G7E0_9BURK|nr:MULTISPECIES: DUF4124 domain-containing protein [unclassified Acidovorax]MCD2511569.1 DUF4124 domain-containing protein [Acidovorax sp. D4N7]UYG50953.1 DUF4124 domain-containing protein [Acidovorax sp. 5MLIR]
MKEAHLPARQCHALGLALAALCALAAPAQGQVLRCTDARTGAVSYTDGSCESGGKVEQVLPARSAEALAREREEAAQAIARKEQRLREEAAAAALNPPPAPAAAAPVEPPRCVQSRQQLQSLLARPGRDASAYSQQLAAAQQQVELDCLGAQAYRELEQSRARSAVPAAPLVVLPPLRPVRPLPPPMQPPRPEMRHCNVFRCYDHQGNVYPR